MGRIRSIKPEFPQSESIGKLSRDARLLFIQLWTLVDDSGRTRAASRMLASLLYPYDEDAASLIDGWMEELERGDHVRRYVVEGCSYLEIINFLKHQKIDKPSASKLPAFDESSSKPREGSPKPRESSTTDQEGIKEGIKEGTGCESSPPSPNGVVSPAAGLPSSENKIEAVDIARAVVIETGLSGPLIWDAIRAQAMVELNAGASPDLIKNGMVDAWNEFQRSVREDKLLPSVGRSAQAFFSEGKWKDSKLWGLKKGQFAWK